MNKYDIDKVNLHKGRLDTSNHKHYVEFSFVGPFDELFNLEMLPWSDEPSEKYVAMTKFDGTELFAVLNRLDIPYDKQLIFNQYHDEKNHSVEVFHNVEDTRVFAYFDMEKPADYQLDMFLLGISCRKEDEKEIHEMLLEIYRKLQTSSPFEFNYGSSQLYDKTFLSYFYFYENDYNLFKRQMHHHNLPK